MKTYKERTIVAKAPMRLDLAGGPTDVSPFAETEGGVVVNVAVAKYATVKISTRPDDLVKVKSIDIGVEAIYEKSKLAQEGDPLLLICAATSYLMPDDGVDVEAFVDAPVGSGLGASAALAVALVGALRAYNNEEVSLTKVATDALYIENDLLKIINGGQDQFASAFGGFNLFVFDKNGIQRKKLLVDVKSIQEFEDKCILVYSGETRISGSVLSKVMGDYQKGLPGAGENLRKIKLYAELISNILVGGDLSDLGEYLMGVLNSQTKLHQSVVTPNIKEILKIAQEVGIEGGKIAGAGGGGVVLLFTPKKSVRALRSALEQHGYLTSPLIVSKSGLEYREVNH